MLFFVDNKGTIIAGKPSPVYQGSADTNNIVLVAPFAANLEFGVAFTLPNGVTTEMYMMSRGGAVNSVEYAPTGKGMAIWTFSMPSEIAAYYGTVYAQFYAYGVNGQITPTSRTSFVVAKGVPQILPETPSQDIYNRILTVLSQLNSQLEGGTYAARAIYWWINTFTYGMNEITFYPIGTYGAFVRSIVTENTNNQPYNNDGVLDSAHWQELANFNRIYEAEQNAIESAQNAAESEKNAAASEQASAASQAAAAQSESNAATSERNAALSEEHAAESETNAAVSEKNAQDSAVSAAASATEAAESAKTVTDYLGKTTVFVEQLPSVGDPSLLYFVAGDSNNLFSIYTWENGAWKLLGAANLVVNNTGIVFGALTTDGWAENSQKINIEKVTSATNVSASAAKGFAAAYLQYGIELSETVEGGVIFTCKTVPAENIAVILEITQQQEIPDSVGYYTETEVDALIAAERSAREQEDENLQTAIETEESERKAAVTSLQQDLSTETTARENADSALQNGIDNEASARQQAVQSLQQSITTEANTRAQTDTTLQNAIDAEETARQQAVSSLQQSLSSETTARENADNNLQTAIDTEETERKATDTTLQSNINSEASTRASADASLGNRIDDIVDGTTTVGKATADGDGNNIATTYATQSALNTGLNAKQNITDNSLETTSKTVVGAINENKAAIDGLRNDMIATDHFKGFAATAGDVQDISGDLNDFVYCIATGTIWTYGANGWEDSGEAYPSDATPLATTTPLMDGTAAAGTSNSAARADHIHPTDTSRAAASALTAETTARQNADTQLQTNIDSEASARVAAVQQLQTEIGNVGATMPIKNAENVTAQINGHNISDIFENNGITAKEATHAESADSANDPNAVHYTAQTLSATEQSQARTNIGAAAQSALNEEINTRASADTMLGNQIAAEKTSRENADNDLQTTIDNEVSARASADTSLQAAINAKYTKPSTGVPKTDLAEAVQSSLDKADSALQSVPDATSTTKGIALLGATGGAARYGQKADVGLSNVDNVKQYSASNPPPYPVISVNGKTGAVNITSVDNATSADELSAVGTICVNLQSTIRPTYTNGGNITPGVTGILTAIHGGTGASRLDLVTVGRATADENGNNIADSISDLNDDIREIRGYFPSINDLIPGATTTSGETYPDSIYVPTSRGPNTNYILYWNNSKPAWIYCGSRVVSAVSNIVTSWQSYYQANPFNARQGYVRFKYSTSNDVLICFGIFSTSGTITFLRSYSVAPFVLVAPGAKSDMLTSRGVPTNVTTTSFTTNSSGIYPQMWMSIGLCSAS